MKTETDRKGMIHLVEEHFDPIIKDIDVVMVAMSCRSIQRIILEYTDDDRVEELNKMQFLVSWRAILDDMVIDAIKITSKKITIRLHRNERRSEK